jgi:hypothetical protein
MKARVSVIAFATIMALALGRPIRAQESGAASETDAARSRQASPLEPSTGAVDSLMTPEGGTVWGTFFSYGFTQEINNSTVNTEIAVGGLRWSHLWGEQFGGFFRGHPAFGIELLPAVSFFEDQRTTRAFGFNLLYEHNFSRRNRVRPVWRVGTGWLHANQEIPIGEKQRNFSLLMDFGIDVMVSDGMAVFLGYRFHHVSNADRGDRNPGFNAHTMMFGLSLYRWSGGSQ